MSHGKQRKENNCLNCNAVVSGRFCSVCGQENIEPKETFWQLIAHVTYDFFHYDGKFFSTLKVLLFKPGVITHEYVRGRRANYLHPIRMYIFTSAIFFIIFISFVIHDGTNFIQNEKSLTTTERKGLNKTIERLKDSLNKTNDPAKRQALQKSIYALQIVPAYLNQDSAIIKDVNKELVQFDSGENSDNFIGNFPSTIYEYNTQQAALSPGKKDSKLKHLIKLKAIEINGKFKNDRDGFQTELTDHFLHSLPTMMFISLPVVALLFQLLYIRRKQFTYVQHGVFSIHVYIAIYILLLFFYLFTGLNNLIHFELFKFSSNLTVLCIFYYLYRAMRNFYAQNRWKTLLKFILLFCMYIIILIILTTLFLVTSIIRV